VRLSRFTITQPKASEWSMKPVWVVFRVKTLPWAYPCL